MAEGFAKELGKGLIEACSAGLMPAGVVHPKAIAVMKEAGIDILSQKSKALDLNILVRIDIIVTLCGHAEASCPMTPPSINRLHWPINDPVAAIGTEEQIMNEFRKARDEIKTKIEDFIQLLKKGGV